MRTEKARLPTPPPNRPPFSFKTDRDLSFLPLRLPVPEQRSALLTSRFFKFPASSLHPNPPASVMKNSAPFLPLLAAALSLVQSTHAHGFVSNFAIDGTGYQGNVPNGKTDPSPIRQVTDQSPIYGATSPTVNCGWGAPNAALVVDAMPGSKLAWDWKTASLGNWPHNTGAFSISHTSPLRVFNRPARIPGPVMTYLASCGSTTCDNFDSRTAKWFKIDQAGRDGSGNWVQQQISQFLSLFLRTPGFMSTHSEWQRLLY